MLFLVRTMINLMEQLLIVGLGFHFLTAGNTQFTYDLARPINGTGAGFLMDFPFVYVKPAGVLANARRPSV